MLSLILINEGIYDMCMYLNIIILALYTVILIIFNRLKILIVELPF